jgi:frataxin
MTTEPSSYQPIPESEFRERADATLEYLFEKLDEEDVGGVLDMDLQDGILSIATNTGHAFVVSRHAPSKEIWLSSPLTGGLHFSYPRGQQDDWYLRDGRTLTVVLSEEVSQTTGCEFALGT